MITAQNISKSYKSVKALDNVSFDVHHGEIFGIIGPDGAGKTTLMRILASLLLPDTGTAKVAGCDTNKDFKALRRKIGYMPGRFSLYQDLTVEENLRFFATVFNTTISENYDLIRDIYSHIEPFKKRKAGDLSGGMKQKLALSCALIHRPEVLLLDEPTTGVDPISRRDLWDMLARLKAQGITIVVSTPYMDEAARTDRMAMIDKGKFFTIDSPANIIRQFDAPLWSVNADNLFHLLGALRQMPEIHTVFSFGDSLHVVPKPQANIDQIRALLPQDAILKPITANLEDCFMKFTAPKP